MNFAGPRRRGGLPRKYHLTDEARDLILREYDSKNRQEIAAHLGVPPWVVSRWAGELGVRRTKEPFWTEAEIDFLRRNLGRLGYRKMAEKLGRTRTAVLLKCKRLGLRQSQDGYTARELARLLGVDDHKVIEWIDREWLIAGRRQSDRQAVQGGDHYLIGDPAVRFFVAEHPEEIDLRRVDRDWFLRLLTEPLRNDARRAS